MPTRRTVLRNGASVGAGTLVGVLALPSPRDAPAIDRTVEGREQASAPSAVAPWLEADEPIADEDDAPIARYQYRPRKPDAGDREIADDGDAFVATSPINVVLVPDVDEGTTGLERVMAVLDDADWLREPEEYARYAWDRTARRYVRQQATAAETYYGTSGRFHVRCWAFEGVVSMQIHEDTPARPKHGTASYERGRRAMEAIYAASGWDVAGSIDLDNEQKPDHDGRATVLAESTTDGAPASPGTADGTEGRS